MQSELKINRSEHVPSAEDFSSQIESKNVPAVLQGCINDWKACSKWNPSNGGLDYLQERVGSSVVEAMLSRAAPVFYGDIRSHERVTLPFSTFVTYCKSCLQLTSDIRGVCVESEGCGSGMTPAASNESCLTPGDGHQVYLAQVPILNIENKESSSLETLLEDIRKPTFLETKQLASINLWMNSARSRSSTHYDPHHNLLCVVAGCKQVVLWPPSASSFLYPMPIYGEASNHSALDIDRPDISIYSRAKHSMDYSQKVILHTGDALFIPEGWFHQVDSDDLTIAINFWWESNTMSSMLEHMDAYYLRIILRRLVEKEMNQMLHWTAVDDRKAGEDRDEQPNNEVAGSHEPYSDDLACGDFSKVKNQRHGILPNQLEPLALQALHELVSLVNDNINDAGQSQPDQFDAGQSQPEQFDACQSQPEQVTSMNGSVVKHEKKQAMKAKTFFLEDDPVANILWNLKPLMLQNVLLTMVHNFPRTLEALIMHMLSPAGAEVLTRKFDEMDQQNKKQDQAEFYRLFYSVFNDQFAAMDAILHGKESFSFQAFRNVLDQYLGVNSDPAQHSSGRNLMGPTPTT
ncbi:2-oxoglutarate (2OG) and Fe(II)-dependent oxygenase superfamily protein isoform X2 [Tasmannia lanceolata]|uniref:2-oxoglutarate (2OG) and Fe(II)-dependent oxygenase superfamily protein isoform X2 n=1 Tax=Tasmannia lanceolata TaxID=3420 RepID=UPI004062DC31